MLPYISLTVPNTRRENSFVISSPRRRITTEGQALMGFAAAILSASREISVAVGSAEISLRPRLLNAAGRSARCLCREVLR